jgi:hypothetical protein
MFDVGGVGVTDRELAQLPASFYGDVLGHDVIAEIAPNGHVEADRARTIIDTLPADLKKTLGSSMCAAGVGHKS